MYPQTNDTGSYQVSTNIPDRRHESNVGFILRNRAALIRVIEIQTDFQHVDKGLASRVEVQNTGFTFWPFRIRFFLRRESLGDTPGNQIRQVIKIPGLKV